MSDQNQAIRDDIAFLRSLAEEGRNGPLTGGSFMLAGGLIFGVASLAVWWGARSPGQPWTAYVWPVSGLVFFAVLMFAKWRQTRAGEASSGSKAAGIAWSGIGMAMFSIIMSLMLMAHQANDWRIAATAGPVFLSLYGAAWFIAARISRRRWLDAVWMASFAMSGITAVVFQDPASGFLVYGVSLLLLAALPGLILMLAARKG